MWYATPLFIFTACSFILSRGATEKVMKGVHFIMSTLVNVLPLDLQLNLILGPSQQHSPRIKVEGGQVHGASSVLMELGLLDKWRPSMRVLGACPLPTGPPKLCDFLWFIFKFTRNGIDTAAATLVLLHAISQQVDLHIESSEYFSHTRVSHPLPPQQVLNKLPGLKHALARKRLGTTMN